MQTRTTVTHKFEPKGEDGTLPLQFTLVRRTEHEARRTDREIWRLDGTVTPNLINEELTTFSRRQLCALIADGADWLAYNPVTDD
jgi:hypothetical protein